MALWKLILAYDGTAFHGWQVQPGLATVQGSLASALRSLVGERVLPQGSGRTDAGVHALGQVASFSLDAPIPPPNLLRALNRILPGAIRVLSAEHMPDGFHARHSAKCKTYEYRIFPRAGLRPGPGREQTNRGPDRICPPWLTPYVWDCPLRLDLARAQAAAAYVLGEHDFTSFAAASPDLTERGLVQFDPPEDALSETCLNDCTPCTTRSAVRMIHAIGWNLEPDKNAGEAILVFRVTGSGFLHHMVRNLVGTFADIAFGRREPADVPVMLAALSRSAAGPTAPARGLFLHSVEYGS
jgi:tRNA pseudouridine38-40 synthase